MTTHTDTHTAIPTRINVIKTREGRWTWRIEEVLRSGYAPLAWSAAGETYALRREARAAAEEILAEFAGEVSR